MKRFLWRELSLCFKGEKTTNVFTVSFAGETSGGLLGSFGKCSLQRHREMVSNSHLREQERRAGARGI